METYGNHQVETLPDYLKQYVVDQHYERYTAIDHAVWRYVMRQNYSYLKNVAYYPYIKGLEQAGLSIEKVPDMQQVNDKLGEIGWGAVTVDGFIPPAAFMEFQFYKVLVIAADIRHIDHIEYTPAPDIIHESAGHAPIIADSDYNKYLSYFGEIGRKAMLSAKDIELYDAIRDLSILKENINTPETKIIEAEQKLQNISENMGEPSEMALLSRLHWWTVEYGLIGDLENPKIYGAGLLSSIKESVTCLNPNVKKLPYTIDTINYAYDITKFQPQLFVTPTFQNLIDVLEEYADSMAFRKGGKEGLQKAIKSKEVATVVLSSGIQISGKFSDFREKDGELCFIKTDGPTALSFKDNELEGHGKTYHFHGFSSPIGKIPGLKVALEDISENDLETLNLKIGNFSNLHFESGIKLKGYLNSYLYKDGKLILLSFGDCIVSQGDEILFRPEWGNFDMVVGEKVVSVFIGAADKMAFEEIPYCSNNATVKVNYGESDLALLEIYSEIRKIRSGESEIALLPELFTWLKNDFPNDWLASLEIYEIIAEFSEFADFKKEVFEHLSALRKQFGKLIDDGLYIIGN